MVLEFFVTLIFFLITVINLLTLFFILAIGGKSKIMAFFYAFITFFLPSLLIANYFFKASWISLSILCALLVVQSKILQKINLLLEKIRIVLTQSNITGLPSKCSLLLGLLKLEISSLINQNSNIPGKFYFAGTTFFYPDLHHMKSLIYEIFVNREYSVYFLSEKSPFIIDCGANIGATTLFLKKMYRDAQILAFEPDPVSFSFLQKNIEKNKLQGVRLEQKALAAEAGKVLFSGGQHTISSSRFFESKNNLFEVEAVQLSDYIDRPVDLLKIDVEGAESDIIKDLVASGKILQIKNIIMEYHYTFAHFNALSASLQKLEDSGFSIEIRYLSNPLRAYEHSLETIDKVQAITIFASKKNVV